MVDELSDFDVLGIALRKLAIQKDLVTAEDTGDLPSGMKQIGGGSRLVAKACTDPAFKARATADGVAACREIGIDKRKPTGWGTPSDYMPLQVIESRRCTM